MHAALRDATCWPNGTRTLATGVVGPEVPPIRDLMHVPVSGFDRTRVAATRGTHAGFLLVGAGGLGAGASPKSAGLRTHTLVGVSAALFMLVSKYGFMDILANGRIVLDPSRVAAQVVSGIGFIGGGIIFMRRDVVRGLTTAASIWLTAALGMACGAGLPILAVATTIGHFVIMLVFPKLVRRLPRPRRVATEIQISYDDGRELCAPSSSNVRSFVLPLAACGWTVRAASWAAARR